MSKKSRILAIIFLNFLFVFGLSSCLESVDLMTENSKTGGLIDVVQILQYKPASTVSVDVDILIYKGPRVKSIQVYKKFTHFVDVAGSVSLSESESVLLGTISVDDDNSTDTVFVGNSYTWDDLKIGIPQLPDGYDIPADPSGATIGDYFTLNYVSVLADGREVTCIPETHIIVANFFAGYYESNLKYFHPTLGGTYPTDPYFVDSFLKELITISNAKCETSFALWDDAQMDIQINVDNTITFSVSNFSYIVNEGDPYDALNVSHYDPATKTIYLYYYYDAIGGYRVFWETLTPYIEK